MERVSLRTGPKRPRLQVEWAKEVVLGTVEPWGSTSRKGDRPSKRKEGELAHLGAHKVPSQRPIS